MKKILFVAQNLQIGGVQKALINHLKTVPAGDDIYLFTFGDGPLMAEIPPFVRVFRGRRLLRLIATPMQVVLQSKNIVAIVLRVFLTLLVRVIGSKQLYMWLLRGYCTEKFDIAISYFNDVPHNYFNQGTNLFVSEYVQAEKKVAWIHSDPIKANFDTEYCREIYRNFDRIVCVSRAVERNFHQLLPEYAKKTEVIHNFIPTQEVRELAQTATPYSGDKFHVVTVGRVDNASKRMDGIVRVCVRLKSEGITQFQWHIVGNGPDLPGNRQLAEELGVAELVCFEGEQINPFPYIRHADLFALYSAYEGFPMVIGEAQALDTYILTTNYAAAKEQISPEQGIIAENDEEFYQELKRLILCRN